MIINSPLQIILIFMHFAAEHHSSPLLSDILGRLLNPSTQWKTSTIMQFGIALPAVVQLNFY